MNKSEKKNSFFQSSGLFSLKGTGMWRCINSVCARGGAGTRTGPPGSLRSKSASSASADGAARGLRLPGPSLRNRPRRRPGVRGGTACPGLRCASDGWAFLTRGTEMFSRSEGGVMERTGRSLCFRNKHLQHLAALVVLQLLP